MTPVRRREGLGWPRPWATLAAAQPVRPLAADGAARVVAVVGTGRSGSTLLAFLLNAHPAIATVGELTGPPPGASAERSR